MDIERALSKARAQLVIENPFMASIICGMQVIVDPTINPPTLQTNGVVVKVHPEWAKAHSPEELKWAYCHEVMHCVLQHIIRTGPRNPVKANIAQDVVINCLLEQEMADRQLKTGMRRPAGVIWEAHPMLGNKTALQLFAEGKTSEGVYALLPDPPAGSDKGSQWDDCQQVPGDAAQQAEASARWKVKVSQAAAAAKMCGKLSANMEKFVTEVLEPKVRWADQLRHFFTKRARVHRSFARPDRRFMSQKLYMPAKTGVNMGDILIAFDQSGSVSQREINEFAAEMRAIQEDCCPPTVHVLYFASTVMKHDTFEQGEPVVISPNGTGGTAFSPIFRYAEEHDIQPEACVVLTDLECNDFGPPPEYPVLWASTGRATAPWGEVIMLRDKRRG